MKSFLNFLNVIKQLVNHARIYLSQEGQNSANNYPKISTVLEYKSYFNSFSVIGGLSSGIVLG